MVVDESGHDGSSAQVDAAGGRAGKPAHVLIGPDCDDPIAGNGDGLRDGEALIDGDDLAVREDEIGLGLLRVQETQAAHHGQTRNYCRQGSTIHRALLLIPAGGSCEPSRAVRRA